jgi:hypothetical protein
MAIGRLVYALHLKTMYAVARHRDGEQCASPCAWIWLAGWPRQFQWQGFPDADSRPPRIAWRASRSVSEVDDAAYDRDVAEYFHEIGLPNWLLERAKSTRGTAGRLLTTDELKMLGSWDMQFLSQMHRECPASYDYFLHEMAAAFMIFSKIEQGVDGLTTSESPAYRWILENQSASGALACGMFLQDADRRRAAKAVFARMGRDR